MKIYWTTKEKFEKYQDTLPHQDYNVVKKNAFQDVKYKDGVLIWLDFPENTELEKADL